MVGYSFCDTCLRAAILLTVNGHNLGGLMLDSNHGWLLFMAMASGVFWLIAYLLIVYYRGFKDHSYGMPVVALVGNLAWEIIFGLGIETGCPATWASCPAFAHPGPQFHLADIRLRHSLHRIQVRPPVFHRCSQQVLLRDCSGRNCGRVRAFMLQRCPRVFGFRMPGE